MIILVLDDDRVASLGDDGKWKSSDKRLEMYLNARHNSVRWPPSPAAGPNQHGAQATAALKDLGGNLRFSEMTEDDGVVY